MLRPGLTVGILAAGLLAVAAPAARAERFVDNSGLAPGSFVWDPAIGAHPATTIVVSLSQGVVHAFKGPSAAGFAMARIGGRRASAPGGIFVVTGLGSADGVGGAVVRGNELFTRRGERFAEADGQVATAPAFARLLVGATMRGTAVVVARERSAPQPFAAAGPFLESPAGNVETGSIDAADGSAGKQSARAGDRGADRFTAPALTNQGSAETEPPLPSGGVRIASLVVSRADLAAYVLQDGRVTDRLPVAIDDPTEAFGLHAMTLLVPPTAGQPPQWLGFGIDDEPDAAHVVGTRAEAMLRRVRFLDRERTAAAAQKLRPGALVVLMDGHGPSATEMPRTSIALLHGDMVASPASQPRPAIVEPKAQAVAPPARSGAAPGKRSSATAAGRGRAAASRGTRPRGPLDHREDYPYSIYWPY